MKKILLALMLLCFAITLVGCQNNGFLSQIKSDLVPKSNSLLQNQTYYFNKNQINVRSADMISLIKQANYLVKHPNISVILIGNTDERGSHAYNLALGWKRVQSAADILMQQGVLPKQIEMISYGEENPASLWHNDKSWALNRRVNLIYRDI